MRLSRWVLGGIAAVSFAVLPTGTGWTAEFTLTCGHDHTPQDFYPVLWGKFKDLVEQRSNGRIAVRVVGGSQLGDEAQLVENMKIGSVDCAGASVGNIGGHIPKASLLGVPYIIESQQHLQRLIDSNRPYFKKLAELVQATGHWRAMGITTAGVRSVYNSKKPVKTPDDLKGLKIRVMSSDVQVKSWKALGAVPTSLPFSEVYTALLTKVVDGAEGAPLALINNKHIEGTKYYSQTAHMVATGVTLLSEKAYQKLPAELRPIVLQAGAEGTAAGRAFEVDANKKALQKAVEMGLIVNEVDPAPFIALTRDLHEQFARDLGADDMLKIIRAEAAPR